MCLLGRNADDLRKSALDLDVRGPSGIATGFAICDLEQPSSFSSALDEAARQLGGFDTVVVTAGLFATQDRLEQDLELTRRLLVVDFAHTVLFCEQVRARLIASGGSTLCVISSVAGERGRKPVVLMARPRPGSRDTSRDWITSSAVRVCESSASNPVSCGRR